LEITIEEHTPYGHWRDVSANEATTQRMMVNNFGEVFNTGLALKAPDDKWLEMPVFAGPPGSGREVLAGFDQFRKQLLAVERTPKELQLSSRRAWLMKLDNGTVLELGRSDAIARLQRYIRAYHQLATLQAANSHIDLRYQNGLAVRTLVAVKSK
jgi:cell division protein FtsQ